MQKWSRHKPSRSKLEKAAKEVEGSGPDNLLFNVQGANRLAVDRSDRNRQDWSHRIRIGHANPFRMIKGGRFESVNGQWKKVLVGSRYIYFHMSSSP